MRNDNTAMRERRKNGFSPPYTAAQISTWILLPLLFLEFVFFASPILPLIASIVCTVLLFAFTSMSAYYGFKASYVDPMDVHLAKHLKKINRKSDDDPQDDEDDENGNGNAPQESLKHCWICDTQVSEHAMHCKFCNKCIGNFDHHCMWLNTCVGKANYPYFLRLMIYISLMLIVHWTVQVALVVDIFLDENEERSRQRAIEQWFPSVEAYIPVTSVLIAFGVLDLILISLIGQLLYFHWGLRREGLTTYKYIVRETQRKRERTQNLARRHNQRMVAISKANDEGRTCYAHKLRYGGRFADFTGCTIIDPLPKPKRTTSAREQSSNNGAEIANGNSTDASNDASPPNLFQYQQDTPLNQ